MRDAVGAIDRETLTPQAGGGASRHRPIVGLDLLRFGAAALVMVFHLGFTAWADPLSEASGLLAGAARFPELLGFGRNGWVGVPIFFVISGFVIAYSAQGATAGSFARSRALRLLPGVWICGTVSFVLALLFAPEAASVLAARYAQTLVLSPVPRWIDGVYWTLPVEIMFYALVWALLVAGRRSLLEPVMIGVGLFSAAVWLVAFSGRVPGLDVLAGKRVAQLLLVTHGCAFAMGVLAWRFAQAGASRLRVVASAVCLLGVLAQVRMEEFRVADDFHLSAPNGAAPAIVLWFLLAFALAIGFNDALLRRLPAAVVRGTRFLGLATYPLYLLHTFVGTLAMRGAVRAGLPRLPALGVGVSMALAAALLVAARGEPMLRRALAARLDRNLRSAGRRPVVRLAGRATSAD